jgi:hypothetical protein
MQIVATGTGRNPDALKNPERNGSIYKMCSIAGKMQGQVLNSLNAELYFINI